MATSRSSDLAVNKKTLLYVGGLDASVDESTVRAAFVPFGEVLGVEIPRDQLTRKNRGFAFVEFEEPDDAGHAVDNMHNSELFGRVLKVNLARASTAAKVGVWAQAGSWYDRSLKEDASEVDALIRNQKGNESKGVDGGVDSQGPDGKVAGEKRVRLKEVAYVKKTGELETYVVQDTGRGGGASAGPPLKRAKP